MHAAATPNGLGRAEASLRPGQGDRADDANPMKSIGKALELLLVFSDATKSMSVSEISSRLGIHKSTASRILTTLMRYRFVERDPDSGRYSVGPGILSLAGLALARYQLPSSARRELEILAELTGETVTVGGWNGREAVNLDQILGPAGYPHFAPPGRINPVHCTAFGKTFLAHQPPEIVDELLVGPLAQFTVATITDPLRLREELDRVRAQGYAESRGEFTDDAFTIAAPVFSSSGRIAYAVAVTMSGERFLDEKAPFRLKSLLLATRELSAKLGAPAAARIAAR